MMLRSLAAVIGAAVTMSLAAGSAAAAAAPATPAALRMMAATFAVSDLDRAVAFYTQGLGLTAARVIENKANTEVPLLFPGGGMSLLVIKWKDAAAAPKPRVGRVILDVPDLRALEARLTAGGYRLRGPIVEQPQHHVLVAVVEDPDGNELELVPAAALSEWVLPLRGRTRSAAQ
jgi:catechol 2,3-dioxygenase-like lactoylglutathione lyase family enzyme